MAIDNFPACLAFVWRPENDGQPDHTDPDDTGGETNMGVTAASWGWAVQHGYVAPGPLATATRDGLAAVLAAECWTPCGCGSLARGVDLAVFNLAMAAGAGRAAYILQAVVGTEQDGIVGPITLAAAAAMAPADLIAAFTDREESFYARCPTAWKFLRGWDRRAEDCRRLAVTMLPPKQESLSC